MAMTARRSPPSFTSPNDRSPPVGPLAACQSAVWNSHASGDSWTNASHAFALIVARGRTLKVCAIASTITDERAGWKDFYGPRARTALRETAERFHPHDCRNVDSQRNHSAGRQRSALLVTGTTLPPCASIV